MVKIVCLGNEFIEEDCFAKKVGTLLSKDFDVVNIRDSFQLMEILSRGLGIVLLDVVEGLKEVKKIKVEDIRVDSIISAHDFDVGQVLRLLNADIDIVGIPMNGDVEKIERKIREIISS